MTKHLQPVIPSLVSGDQASFVLGRSIAESYSYVADLLLLLLLPLRLHDCS